MRNANQSATVIEPAYVYDDGNGAKSVPVCYFGPENTITKEDIPIGTLVDDAIETTGCQEGYLTFSISNARKEVSLYVYQGVGKSSDANVLSQIPSFIGGQIVPIVSIDYNVAGVQVNQLLGGFDSFIIEWGVDTDLVVYAADDAKNLEIFSSDTAFVDIFAYDFDSKIADYEIFPFTVVQQRSSGLGSNTYASARGKLFGHWAVCLVTASFFF
jgi:hypothetical protein